MRWAVVGALVAGLAVPGCARRGGINTTTAAVDDARGGAAAPAGGSPKHQKRDLEQVLAGKGRVVVDGETLRASLSSDVLFESGSARLQPGADAEIARIAEIVQRRPGTVLDIAGHTDNRGTERHNLDLSERRAAAIRDGLVKSGLDASRIRTRGDGEHAPVATNDTATGRSANRRIEITVRPADGLAREQTGAPSEQPQ
jgi:outer membrane protein OmpA-like peptidoglycan-associated protein